MTQWNAVLQPDFCELFNLEWPAVKWIILIEYYRPRFNSCPFVDCVELGYSVRLKSVHTLFVVTLLLLLFVTNLYS